MLLGSHAYMYYVPVLQVYMYIPVLYRVVSGVITAPITAPAAPTFWSKKWVFKWKKYQGIVQVQYIDLFLEPRSLPESDGHRDHGGIGGSKNKYFFLIVFQRLMP